MATQVLSPAGRAPRRLRRPRYTVVTGDYYILYPDLPRNQPEPDGDTTSFLPDSDDLVQSLRRFSGVGPDRKRMGTYSVRFEGIDALETHFDNRHQNLELAQAARDRMLQLMGFGRVEFWPDSPNKIKSAQHHPVRGYLLANGIESHGRVLGLVYPGQLDSSAAEGDPVFVDEARLDASVNAALIRDGLAYGELYATMPLDLIRHVRQLVKGARQEGTGLWPRESVTRNTRVQLQGLADLPVRGSGFLRRLGPCGSDQSRRPCAAADRRVGTHA